MIHYGDGGGDGAGIPNPVWDDEEIQYLIPLGICRVTNKCMRVEDKNKKGKTRPHSALLPTLMYPIKF